jgi:hypothetical protein
VEEACSELPLNAPAAAKPPNTMASTISRTAPTNSRRRRYTAVLGCRIPREFVREPDADALLPDELLPDELPCLPILLG